MGVLDTALGDKGGKQAEGHAQGDGAKKNSHKARQGFRDYCSGEVKFLGLALAKRGQGLEEDYGHSIIEHTLAEDERIQLRLHAHLPQHRNRRYSVCCREQRPKQQPFLWAVGVDADEKAGGGKVEQAHARNNRGDDGANNCKEDDGRKVSEKVTLVKRVARLKQDRGNEVQEKDGVEVLAYQKISKVSALLHLLENLYREYF